MKNKTLSLLDRLLTLWIFLAMAIGVTLSVYIPVVNQWISHFTFSGTSLPIVIGLLVMMYPPLAKVEFKGFISSFGETKKISLSLCLNWFIGPLLMFVLSLIFLHNKPLYMVGLIIVGLARCIAMVIVWNDLAGGNRAFCASLVAINAVFQMVAFALYATFFLKVLLPMFGFHAISAQFSSLTIAKSVFIYLGVPFVLGLGGRSVLVKLKGKSWYNDTYLPAISPLTLIALLYTIILLFAAQGADLIKLPLDVLQIALPLFIYFIVIFFLSFYLSRLCKVKAKSAKTLAFTSASNNFELAIAVCIAIFGVHSPVALAAVVGPLIEVPVMLALVYVSRYMTK